MIMRHTHYDSPANILYTSPTVLPSPPTILTPSFPSPCMPSAVSDDMCEEPQGDSISSSTYGIISAGVIILLLLLTIAILSVLLWMSRRKNGPKLIDNSAYHTHTTEINTDPNTVMQTVDANAPPEASTATSLPTCPSHVYQQPGENGDIASVVQVENEDTDIATSVNPAYEALQNGRDSSQYDYALCGYRPVDQYL